jgi:hypothetical protein
LLYGEGSVAEDYKGLKARHYRWFEEASYEAQDGYMDNAMRFKAQEAWIKTEEFLTKAWKSRQGQSSGQDE